MRLYFFNHYMLSGIQQGIQAGHAAVELMMKYGIDPFPDNKEQKNMVLDWAESYKTFILLNGGDWKNISKLRDILSRQDKYPWTYFEESDMGNLTTSLCVLLPEKMYSDEAKFIGKYSIERDPTIPWVIPYPYTEWEVELLAEMSGMKLAYG